MGLQGKERSEKCWNCFHTIEAVMPLRDRNIWSHGETSSIVKLCQLYLETKNLSLVTVHAPSLVLTTPP